MYPNKKKVIAMLLDGKIYNVLLFHHKACLGKQSPNYEFHT